MKRYVMARPGGRILVTVYQEREGDVRHLGPLRHLVQHSPDGFEWGYGGSGPFDLARSIVGDLLGQKDPHPVDYQRIKRALVATLPERGGEITEDQVLELLADRFGDL